MKNSHQLLKQLTEVEEGSLGRGSGTKLKEKLALFKLTANAMVKVSSCSQGGITM